MSAYGAQDLLQSQDAGPRLQVLALRYLLRASVGHAGRVPAVHRGAAAERRARDLRHARERQHRVPDAGDQRTQQHNPGGAAPPVVRWHRQVQRRDRHRPLRQHPGQTHQQAGHRASQSGDVPAGQQGTSQLADHRAGTGG
eukprot:GHVL01003430.1.p2 GENE.GHVL01003430.1~~GHVL01003430.1.p2  ORF type:complete len:141 (+),score=14.99 GHVL01003430.1:227-649(+)